MQEHDEPTKKLRRKIEECIRTTFTKEKLEALATLLDVVNTPKTQHDNEKEKLL